MTQDSHDHDGAAKTPALLKNARRRLSMVWGVPIMALLLGASLVFQTYQEKGPTIEIEFPIAGGLKAEATPIKFLEVEVGRVTEVRLNDTLDGVIVVAELEPEAESYLKEGTVFWLVRPQITMAGISAIETLVSGQYIEVIPSKTGARKSSFVGQLNPPVGARYPNGKTLILETEQLGSIARGTSVYYRNFRAGEVEHYELGERGGPIRIYIVVDEEFAPRVQDDSLFWNASGIEAHVGLEGIDIRTEGLAAILGGGIAFSSPEERSEEAPARSVFPLHASADAAQQARLRSESLELRIETRDGTGIGEGTPVYYRNLEIGRLGKSWLTTDARAIRSEVFIAPRFQPLIRENTRFYKSGGIDVSLGLDGLAIRSKPLRSIALGGVSIATPESLAPQADSLAIFALYDEPEEAWLAWQPVVELEEVREGEALEHRFPPNPDAGALDLILHAAEIASVTLNSEITYRKLAVGRVLEYSLADDGQSVDIHIRIARAYRHLVGNETRFWRPEGLSVDVGLAGLALEFESLRTLALGGIAFDNPQGPGVAAKSRARFPLHADEKTAFRDIWKSRYRTLFVEAPNSTLTIGAPVYFRKFKVGEVGESTLTADALGVRTELRIESAYASLVRTNTRFWSPGALSIRGGLAGVDIEVAPLRAMLVGGVLFATPTIFRAEAEEASVFRLEDDAPAGSAKWRPNLPLSTGVLTAFADSSDEPKALRVLLEAKDVDSINDGDPIFYRGVKIGAVETSDLALDGTHVVLGATIEPRYASLIRSNTQFWNASGIDFDLGLTGLKLETGPLETFLQGGIQIATPEPAEASASDGDRFVLMQKPDDDWQEWSPKLR